MRPGSDRSNESIAIKRWLRWAWWGWLIMLHLVVLTFVLTSSKVRTSCEFVGLCKQAEISDYYLARRSFLRRRASLLGDGFSLVIGDSHIEGLAFERIDAYSLNAGIGGDTSVGLIQRLSDYEPMERWNYIVLAVGFNDLKYRGMEDIVENYQEVLRRLGPNMAVYMTSVLPIDAAAADPKHGRKNELIIALNNALQIEADKHNNVSFVDLYSPVLDTSQSLSSKLHIGDGVHLNRAGQEIIIERLRAKISAEKN